MNWARPIYPLAKIRSNFLIDFKDQLQKTKYNLRDAQKNSKILQKVENFKGNNFPFWPNYQISLDFGI
jgi:hypothetical protein